MAGNKKGGSQAPVKETSGQNRPNGKARKKNPGPDGVERKFVSRSGRVEGRSAAGHAKREAWKAAGGRADHPTIPHWKTGKVHKREVVSASNDA
jgi:hypothetical protein